MSSDSLAIVLFLVGTAITFALAGMSVAGWKHPIIVRCLFGLAAVLALAGFGWPILRLASPLVTTIVSQTATNPVSWFVVLMTAVALFIAPSARAPHLRSIYKDKDGLASDLHTEHVDLPKLKAEFGELSTALQQVERNCHSNNARLNSLERYLPLIMDHIKEHIALSMLFDAVPEIPYFSPDFSKLTDTSMKSEQEAYEKYCDEIKRILGGTQWDFDIRSILQVSDGMGEHRLRMIPHDERPWLDALDLRRYLISRTKAENLEKFIWAQRGEAKSKYVAYLHYWKERSSEWKILKDNQSV